MSASSATRVSVVIPAYNEGAWLPGLVSTLVDRLADLHDVRVEMVVVDDGSDAADSAASHAATEAGAARLRALGMDHTFQFVRAARNRGKGSAIRLGWQHVAPDAEWMGWLDADGAITAAEFLRLVALLRDGPAADLVAGSRIKMAGRHIERRAFRHLQGRVFANIADLWLSLDFYDTQCGVKLLRAECLRPLLPVLVEEGWMLDIEILALMKVRGARFLEVPIDWTDAGTSKVRFGIDQLRMLWALGRIRRRVRRHGVPQRALGESRPRSRSSSASRPAN